MSIGSFSRRLCAAMSNYWPQHQAAAFSLRARLATGNGTSHQEKAVFGLGKLYSLFHK